MVCKRKIPRPVTMDINKIRNRIRGNLKASQLNLAARRYLRDLRRETFIEIRM